MNRLFRFLFLCVLCDSVVQFSSAADPPLRVGFGETDITPALGEQAVFVAGFSHNRRATKVNDPLKVRAFVLADGRKTIAVASVDVIGLFLPNVETIRKGLPGVDYVLVCSTHNHHGPDTLGLW